MSDEMIKIAELRDSEREAIQKIVSKVGTPVYIYFQERMEEQIRRFGDAVEKFSSDVEVQCYFAMLANHNPYLIRQILQAMEDNGLSPGVLCASEGHLRILSRISSLPRRLNIIYSDAFLDESKLSQFIHYLSSSEAYTLILILQTLQQTEIFTQKWPQIKEKMSEKFHVGVRIKLVGSSSKDIYSLYHGQNARFGLMRNNLQEALSKLKSCGISQVGFHIYPGTNILYLSELESLYNGLLQTIQKILTYNSGLELDFIDVGGGFGINYQKREFLNPDKVIEILKNIFSPLSDKKERILIEPGRTIIGPAGVLIAKVVDIKDEGSRKFVVVDTGLSHFARPYIYRQYHQVQVIPQNERRVKTNWDADAFIVGITMASGDFLAGDPLEDAPIKIERVEIGDLIAFLDVGAYGFCMSSNFSGLLKPPEVLVEGKNYYLVRERKEVGYLLAEVPLCLKSL